ncbi:hypothetical protein DJ568_01220 [Mucilaginibacter hurinus]|uniref:DUF4932 domain-containing protein n=1 Tax=Mucilaginibacter hurinus TaxID=2201324 RepID=A0A367GTJ4_9SPHI|nr:DUF4932 domain-containing protein [Mucilaginibacter hurinus]RCH56508.1 hypothetical protein DJ568_01220 [Mucilaginibacter hurinus]
MVKGILKTIVVICCPLLSAGQLSEKISDKVSIGVNKNIETYFIAEKLAVEHIDHYVFSNNKNDFSHQPIVYFAQTRFANWRDSAVIMRIAHILRQMRDVQHDNSQQLEYLTYLKEFPKTGYRWPVPGNLPMFDSARYPGSRELGIELADSLRSFYNKANLEAFFSQNKSFYQGAIKEAKKHIDPKIIPAMEKWYGQHFAGYELYLMPGMPIPSGKDNYRAFGPMLTSPIGNVSAMVFSTTQDLALLKSLAEYQHFGFDNHDVIKFLTVHEIGHSFVNPLINNFKPEIQRDTSLFTRTLAESLKNSYIHNWEVCVIEHLVRLGEIRIAHAAGNYKEESRLRHMHVKESGFILIPLLEQRIKEFEANRKKYAAFNKFLPEIFRYLHSITKEEIDQLVSKNSR